MSRMKEDSRSLDVGDGGAASDLSLIGRYCPERSRPAREPGGMECDSCGCIFIGEEWHNHCAVCAMLAERTKPNGDDNG